MTNATESLIGQEGRSPNSSSPPFLNAKNSVRIGTWNVRTMWETTRSAQVVRLMRDYRLDILGISECRWTGSGKIKIGDGVEILYSGMPEGGPHVHGVALMLSQNTAKSLLEFKPINERLITARLQGKHGSITVVQCYAPTNDSSEDEKDQFYSSLKTVVEQVPTHDVLVVMGDLNAKIGNENAGLERAMGKHGCGKMNENGERLIDFCLDFDLVIGGTLFQHKDIHKLTWKSPDGKTVNQIDHLMINHRWRRSLLDVRVFRGADLYTDHFLVVGSIRLKLKNAYHKKSSKKGYDVSRLKNEKIQKEYSDRLRSCLRTSAYTCLTGDVENRWNSIRDGFCKAAEATLKYQGGNRKEWITEETWASVEERSRIRAKLLDSKSERIRERNQKEYDAMNKIVKKNARRDKRAFADQMAEEAEEAANKRDMGALHKITRRLCGTRKKCSTVVRDREGRILTTDREQAARWVEHFKSVLNQPCPLNTVTPPPASKDLEISVGTPTVKEVKDAIRSLKNGKATGIDAIHAEMLKVDLPTSVGVLSPFFNEVWEREEIPEDWRKGLIVKIPKKGDISVCDNSRGITLLSIPSKVFCRVILNRIRMAVDQRIREEQAGFRAGRGCSDQIFALRNIVEQCIEWNAPLFVNFVDFRKAFDSIHRDTLWAVIRHYGLPQKIVSLIKLFYERFECGVILREGVSDFFEVQTGVRQGCMLSPLLFLILIDYVMRIANERSRGGIQWGISSGRVEYLDDLDYADDLAVLACTQAQIREKTEKVWQTARRVGLEINAPKTKVMCINTTLDAPLTIAGETLECVDSFTYLGSVISKDGSAQKDIKNRLSKARNAFANLRPVWRSSVYSIRTKLHLYNSIVKSVLLYGSECWQVVETDFHKIEAFHNGCLRRICRIFWPRTISNLDLHAKTQSEAIQTAIKKRRLRWLGHVLRMSPNRITRVALRWTPQGKRKQGRPKATWRRTVEKEIKAMGLTWGEAEMAALDRIGWRQRVEASCSARS